MSQAALHLSTQMPSEPETLDPQHWIPLAEAADRLRMERNHLGRICKTKLQARNLAVMAKPNDGGNKTWHILRTWNQVLAPGRVGDLFQVPTLSQYTEDQRQGAQQRATCAERLRYARTHWKGKQADWMPKLLDELRRMFPDMKISRTSLLRWDKDYRTPSDLEKLVDTRGGNRRGAADPACWTMFRDYFLDDRQPTKIDCWRLVRDEARKLGLRWLTYRALCQQLNAHIAPETQAQFQRPADYRRQLRPYNIKDQEMWQAGECWEGDHRQMNIICRIGDNNKLIRPWLTTWIDIRSGRVAGYVLCESPNSTTILAALRMGIKDPINHGGPSALWIDNGKDYDSYTLHGATKSQRKSRIDVKVDEVQAGGVLNRLGIDAHFAIPHNPNGKPHIERFFETLESFDKRFATYTARNTQDKPESLDLALKNRHKVPRFEHILEGLVEHIDGYNKATGKDMDSQYRDNRLEGLSPDEYMLQHCGTVRPMPRDEDLDLLMMKHHKPVRVRREGVYITIAGKSVGYGMNDEILRPLKPGLRDEHNHKVKGRLVNVTYDPADITHIYAWTEDWAIIGKLMMNGLTSKSDVISEADFKEQMRQNRTYINNAKFVRTNSFTNTLTIQQQISHKKQHDMQAVKKQMAEKPLKMVQMPSKSPSDDLQNQQALKAAGAEAYHDSEFDLLSELANVQRRRDDDDDLAPLQFQQPDESAQRLNADVLDLDNSNDTGDDEPISIDLALANADDQDDDETIDLSQLGSDAWSDPDDSADIDTDVLCLDDSTDADMDDDAEVPNILDLMS